jgi:hypothetical protein
MNQSAWPALPLSEWEDTYLTLQRWLQIAGKVALAHAPPMNHWWHIALHVTPRGLSTQVLEYGGLHYVIVFDFRSHEFLVQTSDGRTERLPLSPMPVAEFYERALGALHRLGIAAKIYPVPVEVADTTAFPDDRKHTSYDRAAVERLHRILLSTDHVFRVHRGQYLGKSSPSHFFWGAFDLAVTRFSGRPNPSPPADRVMRDAYSHEVVSHGFWPGGDWITGHRMPEPVFYAYATPEPQGFRDPGVLPASAAYAPDFGEFVLPYEAVRLSHEPGKTLLEFMSSTYARAAQCAAWPVNA